MLTKIWPQYKSSTTLLCGHCLIEEGFIKGQTGIDSYVVVDLYLSGHQLLESMRNDTLWHKIKSELKETGVESLKQIPGLSITLLSGL